MTDPKHLAALLTAAGIAAGAMYGTIQVTTPEAQECAAELGAVRVELADKGARLEWTTTSARGNGRSSGPSLAAPVACGRRPTSPRSPVRRESCAWSARTRSKRPCRPGFVAAVVSPVASVGDGPVPGGA